jgi:hypothetical protein
LISLIYGYGVKTFEGVGKMLKVEKSNFSRFNFAMSLENQLRHNLDKGLHTDNYTLILEHFNNAINTVKFFGTREMMKEIAVNFVNLIEYQATNFHKPRDFYKLLTEFRAFTNTHYPNENLIIESVYKIIETINKTDAKIDCMHKNCCK